MKRTRRKGKKITSDNQALHSYDKLIIRHPHTKYSYKVKSCGARKKGDGNSFSCYTNKILLELRNKWNIRHPENKILSDVPVEIWKQYQDRLHYTCKDEQCWIQQMDDSKSTQLSNEMKMSFAPEKPHYLNKSEWLSNLDIENALKSYERIYPCFEFLGPTPIDYDEKTGDSFVCNKIAKFDLDSFIQRGKFKIGIIFNLDTHKQSGSHWVCLFINIKHSMIYYFDSVGIKMNKRIKKLVNKIIHQGKLLPQPIHFHLEVNKKMHQRKNTECGVYCLFVITALLEDTKTIQDFKETRFSDEDVYELRGVFFQKGGNVIGKI